MASQEYTAALQKSLLDVGPFPGSANSLISSAFTPSTRLDVSFGTRKVDLGNFFRAGECKQPPSISFTPEKEGPAASYAFILTDPGAPTPDDPRFAFWRHYVLAGLQPSANNAVDVTAEHTLTEYLAPGLKDDSKPHRYLFLLYRAPSDWKPTKADVGGEEFVQRRSFKPAEFAKAHGLELVAANWITCAGDG